MILGCLLPKKSTHTPIKPDFLIEKVENNSIHTHLICEIKKHKGDRMEKALNQAVKDIVMSLEEKGNNNNNDRYEVFVILQGGWILDFSNIITISPTWMKKA